MSENPQQYVFTVRGLGRLKERLAVARAAYQAVCDSNPEAREAGDNCVWHDNFAFEENQRQMHQRAHRVRDLEECFRNAVVVSTADVSLDQVRVGTRVHYCVDDSPAEATCVIVGFDDGEPSQRRISYNSPLGAALLGATVGAVVEVTLGGRRRLIEVMRIERAAGEDVP